MEFLFQINDSDSGKAVLLTGRLKNDERCYFTRIDCQTKKFIFGINRLPSFIEFKRYVHDQEVSAGSDFSSKANPPRLGS